MTELFLVLHVIGAVAWVGAGTIFHVHGRRVLASGDESATRRFLADGAYFSIRYFIPVSLLTVIMGVALVVADDSIEFSEPFVVAGLTLVIIAFAMSAGFMGPQNGRLLGGIEAGEFGTPGLTARINRLLTVSAIELSLLWATAVIMVVKPG